MNRNLTPTTTWLPVPGGFSAWRDGVKVAEIIDRGGGCWAFHGEVYGLACSKAEAKKHALAPKSEGQSELYMAGLEAFEAGERILARELEWRWGWWDAQAHYEE